MKSLFIVLIIVLSSILPFAAQTKPLDAKTTAFTNVNVIPMDKERVLQNQTVIVRDGVIAEIGDAKKVKIPKDAVKIDGQGKYLIPGLTDMHVHLQSDEDKFPDALAEDELKIIIANGVTTIRFMIGTPEQLVLRAKSAKGEIMAPTIYAASPHFTGRKQGNDYVVATEQEARDAVKKAKNDGYDFLKVTTFLKPEVYEAIIDEAKKQNIRVVGHADSRYTGVDRAFKAGQQIEHLDGYLEAIMADNAPMKGSVSDIYLGNPKNWDSLDYMDEKKIPIIAKRTVEANPFCDPTLSFFKNVVGVGRTNEEIKAQPDFRFYPSQSTQFWLDHNTRSRAKAASADRLAKYVELRNKIVKAIYDAGGKILAGSDTPEFLLLYGFTLHRELKAINEAGLSTYATLETATKNPAEFFGTLNKTGTIEKGKIADLVLLEANPLDNISNTEKRAGVMVRGKYLTQTEMNKWLDDIAPRFQAVVESK